MHSINGNERIGTVFDLIDAAVSGGATFGELMALLQRYKRLRQELTALEYELSSPLSVGGHIIRT
jgi:hypothetical protein